MYSRATTSSMALRPVLPPAAGLDFFSCLVDMVVVVMREGRCGVGVVGVAG